MVKSSFSDKRQQAIKNLISERLILNQNTLVDLLKSEFNIETNQSILSRELRKLGVIKKEINNKMVYAFPDVDITKELLKLAIIEIKYNEVMIVIKTHPGLASFVGDFIDNKQFNILGCLAGENVVFIACHSIHGIKDIYDTLCKELHYDKTTH